MRTRCAWFSIAVLLFISPVLLHATPLPPNTPAIYTFTVTGSGSLNGISFTDQTITFTTNTTLASVATLSGGNIDRASNAPTTVSVFGVGSDTLIDNISFVVARTAIPNAGISDRTLGLGLVVLQNSDFANISMFDDAGPIDGVGLANYWPVTTPTSSGSLYLSDVSAGNYTALIGDQPATVPEPASLLLLATGMAGAAGVIRKRLA